MDQNQYSDAAYEHEAMGRLKLLARDLGFVLCIFLGFCAGYVSAVLTR
jgi:hypothetical protein